MNVATPDDRALPASGIVDAHVHVWDLDRPDYPWRPDLGVTTTTAEPVEGLLDDMRDAGVSNAVVVQSSIYGFDHRYLRHAVALDPRRLWGIALADPLDPATGELIREMAEKSGVIGLRMIPLRADRDWFGTRAQAIWESAAELSLPITFLAGPSQLGDVARWAGRFPGVTVVIDHLGRPDLAAQDGLAAMAELVALASHPNCHVKVSGIGGLSKVDPPYEDTWPWIRAALDAFGVHRLMWGSDYPYVKSIPSTIEESRRSTAIALSDLDDSDAAEIFGGTARRVFGLEHD